MSQNGSTRTIAVTSGKGGVGKTNLSVNLALQLALLGKKVCIFDADLGMANINILLGLEPDYDLEDVISNGRRLEDVIIRDFHGIDVIPGSSGVERIARLGEQEVDRLIRSFSNLRAYDFLLIDTSAGVNRSILSFCLASSDIVLMITPEPTSLTDAYALLKILTLNGYRGTARIVVNQCRSPKSASGIYRKFKETVKKYLPLDLVLLGVVVKDPKVEEAVRRQEAFLLFSPASNASKCIRHLAERLLNHSQTDLESCGVEPFWSRCLELMQGPVRMKPDRDENNPSAPDSRDEASDISVFPADTGRKPGEKNYPPEKLPEDPVPPADAPPPAPDQVPPPRVEEVSNTPEVLPAHDNHAFLLNRLIEEVSSVSRELSSIRETLKEVAGNRPGNSGSSGLQNGQEVILDLDAFIKTHTSI